MAGAGKFELRPPAPRTVAWLLLGESSGPVGATGIAIVTLGAFLTTTSKSRSRLATPGDQPAKEWHLRSIAGSSQLAHNRQPGQVAPRHTSGEVLRSAGASRQLITRSPSVIGWRPADAVIGCSIWADTEWSVQSGSRVTALALCCDLAERLAIAMPDSGGVPYARWSVVLIGRSGAMSTSELRRRVVESS